MDSIASWLNENLGYIAFFLPLLVGLLYKSSASQQVKAVVMIFVTGVATLVAQTSIGISGDSLVEWGKTMVITLAAYYGVWKPLGAGNPAPDAGVIG